MGSKRLRAVFGVLITAGLILSFVGMLVAVAFVSLPCSQAAPRSVTSPT